MDAELVKQTAVDGGMIPFTTIPAAGLHGVGLRALPRNLLQLGRGTMAARGRLAEFKPDVMLFTGGYLAAPVALVGRRIPSLLYVPDIEPGLALKFLARFATCVALTTEESRDYFPARTRKVVTGYPTRAEFERWDRAAGRDFFDLDNDTPVALVFGGSQGARSINNALLDCLPGLLTRTDAGRQLHIVHISGRRDWDAVQARRDSLPAELLPRYRAYAYLHEMGAALACADLVISRAGASCLGEYPQFGLPAVLTPYPHAWRYQRVNAEYLSDRGAAVIVADEALSEDLQPTIESLFKNREQLAAMRSAMTALHTPGAAGRLAVLLQELATSSKTKGIG
jgi:UDP-N-acetylglucosamine--N-acetylmuramyl-(pentapeptide) pyrophosphoryl-undecaprenol N-acetylglucosamine transferase